MQPNKRCKHDRMMVSSKDFIIPEMLISSYILGQMLLCQTKGNGPKETSMFRRYSMMAYISGEENQGTINKAKWRIHFIGIRQY